MTTATVINLGSVSEEVRQSIVDITLDRLIDVLLRHTEKCGFCHASGLCVQGQVIVMDIEETTGTKLVASVAA